MRNVSIAQKMSEGTNRVKKFGALATCKCTLIFKKKNRTTICSERRKYLWETGKIVPQPGLFHRIFARKFTVAGNGDRKILCPTRRFLVDASIRGGYSLKHRA